MNLQKYNLRFELGSKEKIKTPKYFFSKVNFFCSCLNKKKGFTLIETLIYVAIISLIMGAFISYSISITNLRNKTYVMQEVQANARMAMEVISNYLRIADAVNMTSSTFDIDPGVLSLSMVSSTLNPVVFLLDQDDGVLQMSVGGGEPNNLTSDEVKVTELTFFNFSGSSNKENIGISITVEYSTPISHDFFYSQSLQTSVSLRQ